MRFSPKKLADSKGLKAHKGHKTHTTEASPCFSQCSMKHTGELIPQPRRNTSPSPDSMSQDTHSHTWVKKDKVEQSFSFKETTQPRLTDSKFAVLTSRPHASTRQKGSNSKKGQS